MFSWVGHLFILNRKLQSFSLPSWRLPKGSRVRSAKCSDFRFSLSRPRIEGLKPLSFPPLWLLSWFSLRCPKSSDVWCEVLPLACINLFPFRRCGWESCPASDVQIRSTSVLIFSSPRFHTTLALFFPSLQLGEPFPVRCQSLPRAVSDLPAQKA